MPSERAGLPRRALPAAFFVSGLSGLIFEVVWTRSLVLVFGATSLAVASVLAAYMAGLGLGSVAGGRWAERARRPLLAYGLLEGGVALFGLLLPGLIGALAHLYRPLYLHFAPRFLTFSLLRFGLLFAALLVPTTLMGATLPLLARYVATDTARRADAAVGRLYAANTSGAVLGTLLAGFWLLPAVGLRATNLVACAVGLTLCAAVSWWGWTEPASPPAAAEPPADAGDHRWGILVLVGFGVAGAASMIDEVAWTRALVQVVGPSTYAFSVMLAVFLAGIALGSAAATHALERIHRPRLWFGLVEAFAGGFTLLAVLSFEPVQILYRAWTGAGPGGRGPLSLGMKTAAAAALLGPTTLWLGAAFPLATAAWVRAGGSVSRRVGALYGSNTFGCIAGSVAAGFFMIPGWGIERSLQVAAALNVAVAAALFVTGEGISRRLRLAGVAALTFLALGLARGNIHWNGLLLASGVASGDTQLVFEKPGYTATISVTRQLEPIPALALRTDGKADGSDVGDLNTQVQLGLVPMLLHDHPEKVLVVGLATGTTCGSVLRDPRVKRLDVLEIERAMVDASHYFDAMNGRPLEDPRTHLIEIDARNYYRASDQTYDVIISEPSNPWMSGPSHLFTREAFAEAHDRLAPGGIMLQWVQAYEMSAATSRSIAAAFLAAFPYVRIFLVHDIPDLLIAGSDAPLDLDLDAIARRLGPLAPELHRGSIDDPWDLVGEVIADQASLQGATRGVIPNSDDNGAVEFGAPRDLDADPRVKEALSQGYPGPYQELERRGQSPEVVGGRLGWRIGENYGFILADALVRHLEGQGLHALAQELDASWKVRPGLPPVEGGLWQDLLRRQRLWQLELPQPEGPLELPLPKDSPEQIWLAALQGRRTGPLAPLDFASPLGSLEARAAAATHDCGPVLQAYAGPFKQLLIPGTEEEWGTLRAASAVGEMAQALALCGDQPASQRLKARDLAWRKEMEQELKKYVPDVAHRPLSTVP